MNDFLKIFMVPVDKTKKTIVIKNIQKLQFHCDIKLKITITNFIFIDNLSELDSPNPNPNFIASF